MPGAFAVAVPVATSNPATVFPCCSAAAATALHERAPAADVDLDAVLASGRADAPPCSLAFLVGHALDLVEARDRVADMTRVVQRLFALFRERELLRAHAVPLFLTQAGRAPRAGFTS